MKNVAVCLSLILSPYVLSDFYIAAQGIHFSLSLLQSAGPHEVQSCENANTVVEMSPAELKHAFPELKTLEFEENKEQITLILRKTGENVEATFRNFVNTTSVEEVFERRFGTNGGVEENRFEKFRYLALARGIGNRVGIDEFRTDSKGRRINSLAQGGQLFVTTGFASMANHFLPHYQRGSTFRYLGRQAVTGTKAYVVAFAQRPGEAQLLGRITLPHRTATVLFQGLAWIDPTSYKILRLRTDLLAPRPDLHLKGQTTEVQYGGVSLKSVPMTLWLPRKVTVKTEWAGKTYQNLHRYSGFRLFSVSVGEPGKEQARSGQAGEAGPTSDLEAKELLSAGLALLNEHKVDNAIAKLREAARLDPEDPIVHYNLGAALSQNRDSNGAIAEFREAVRLKPDFLEARNNLGVSLFRTGDREGALREFQEIVQLNPDYPAGRYNLGATLETLGDKPKALEQYRAALALTPGNSSLKERLETLSRSLSPANSSNHQNERKQEPASGHPTSSPTIRVEVKQVLVPVVVADGQGHHVTGLRASDFHVFEDGVAQEITGFSIETSESIAMLGVSGEGRAQGSLSSQAEKPTSPAAGARRTYLICFDTLHSAFENFPRVRESLRRLFEEERDMASQYELIALGRQPLVLQGPTKDPAAVLGAIRSKNFSKAVQSSEVSNLSFRTNQLKRMLDGYCERCPCGNAQPPRSQPLGICPGMKQQLQSFVSTTSREMTLLARSFLVDLKAVVEYLAHMQSARTLIFVSDGFDLVPGRELYSILASYFPRDPELQLTSGEDTQPQLEAILRLAAENNVVVYALDSRGLYTPGGGIYDASNPATSVKGLAMLPELQRRMETIGWEKGSAMAQLAAATGGVYFHNSNDLLRGMRQAFADGREYYLLSYVASNKELDGKFRKITVQVKDKKLIVRAKAGYWAPAN